MFTFVLILAPSSSNLQFLLSGSTERISGEAECCVGFILTMYSLPATRSIGLLRTLKYLNHSFTLSVAAPLTQGLLGAKALEDL